MCRGDGERGCARGCLESRLFGEVGVGSLHGATLRLSRRVALQTSSRRPGQEPSVTGGTVGLPAPAVRLLDFIA